MIGKSTVSNSTNSTFPTEVTDSSASVPPGLTPYTQVTYSVIATIAFLGNMCVISIFLRDRKLLKKSYNMLILSLAIADVLTAILLISNPAFVLGDAFPYPENHYLGKIFCQVVWSRMLLFHMVIFSAYICLALAMERWYAVVHPLTYKAAFSTKHTLVYIGSSCVWSFLLVLSISFEVGYVPLNPPQRRCKWLLLWERQSIRTIVGVVQVLLKMAFPSVTMLVLYAHMIYKTSRSTVTSAESKAKFRGKMTRMVGAACLMLIVCLAPGQINFALAMAGKVKLDTKTHHGLSILAFISSCMNPFIYGLSNKNYRLGFQRLLFPVSKTVGCARRILIRSGVNPENSSKREVSTMEAWEKASDDGGAKKMSNSI